MKKLHFAIFCLFVAALFNACIDINLSSGNNENKINGEGELVEKVIQTDNFNALNLIGFGKIEIVKGPQLKVTIKAQQNIINVMTHHVNSGELCICPEDGISIGETEGIFYEIETPNGLEGVTITGSGDITINGDSQETLNISIIGAGNVNALNTKVSNCNITISGTGNCDVYVLDNLKVTIAGAGNVSYKGEPHVTQNIAGVGKVNQVN